MKILLACLMCVILPISQAIAIDGGPVYGNGNALVSVVGTYAGVLLDVAVGSNNLGIFTVSIPQQGLATGNVFLFTGERTFSGPISGLADPNTDKFIGTLQGIPVVTSGTTTIETLNFHADGTIKAKVKLGKGVGVSSFRLNGTAHVTTTKTSGSCDSNPACDPNISVCCKTMTDYNVRGFKQSNAASGG
jgi:hypothetical protein